MSMSKFFYHVKGTLFRSKNNHDNLIEVNEIFRNESPIIARQNAFNYYQNYIDVFLQSKGEKYISHEETIRRLFDFVKSDQKQYAKIGTHIIDTIDADFDKGLSIYLVMENTKVFTTLEGETCYENKHLIHCLNNDLHDYVSTSPYIIKGLTYEYKLYKKQGYDMANQQQTIEYVTPKSRTLKTTTLYSPINFQALAVAQFLKNIT